jgi:hypothetical protein
VNRNSKNTRIVNSDGKKHKFKESIVNVSRRDINNLDVSDFQEDKVISYTC